MSRYSTTFSYNGNEIQFDIADADSAEKLENAVKNLQETEKTIPKTGSVSAIMRAQIKMLKAFFDETAGEGAGNKFCGEADNYNNACDAYEAFLQFVANQKRSMTERKLSTSVVKHPAYKKKK